MIREIWSQETETMEIIVINPDGSYMDQKGTFYEQWTS